MGKKQKNQPQPVNETASPTKQAEAVKPQVAPAPQPVVPTTPTVVRQLSIFLNKQPESLLGLCKDFSDRKINIESMSISDTVDHSVVRIIVDKSEEAKKMFAEVGAMYVENDLLLVNLNDQPGSLRDFCQKLSESGVNIEYAYGSSSSKLGKANIYVRVLDTQKALAILSKK